jgi:hypothetical protein
MLMLDLRVGEILEVESNCPVFIKLVEKTGRRSRLGISVPAGGARPKVSVTRPLSGESKPDPKG